MIILQAPRAGFIQSTAGLSPTPVKSGDFLVKLDDAEERLALDELALARSLLDTQFLHVSGDLRERRLNLFDESISSYEAFCAYAEVHLSASQAQYENGLVALDRVLEAEVLEVAAKRDLSAAIFEKRVWQSRADQLAKSISEARRGIQLAIDLSEARRKQCVMLAPSSGVAHWLVYADAYVGIGDPLVEIKPE